ncbi:Maltose/maltodextrin ABC transporter, permease protein MalF [Paenibacillus pasadenensis]|uniref:Maltose/maltodextrin transport system permease protein n=1 Tax=Paenibacillus pasadenensis TaxID=217090 RepID=A0A2N5N8H7_9BACL|nr:MULTISPECIES: sugar ABC transporter permease [Paenibacillus]PLT46625.1 Maltose/maltodextrin ABC transporter, permease protein MalF [Paenibacillus pasadenensis]QGG57013.1 ABC transporter permease subunit [Paenibacillus sp. B01]
MQNALQTGPGPGGAPSPKRAAWLSVVPGLGQLYNRRYIKGGILLLLALSLAASLGAWTVQGLQGLVTLGEDPNVDDSRTLLTEGILALLLGLALLAAYGLNIRDAWRDAVRRREGERIPSMRQAFHDSYDKGFPYFVVVPSFILLAMVVIFPLLFMVALAFTNYSLYNSPPAKLLDWVGWANFKELFVNPLWTQSLLSVLSWTVFWTLVATTLQIALAMLLAVLVNDSRIRFKKAIRTVLILPWAVPSFMTVLVFAAMFNDTFGAINTQLLAPFGVQIPWLTDAGWARTAIILIQVWLGFPYVFTLFTGVLQSISKDWYEAADVDGGSRWQKFRFITLPHVLFATAPLLIMQYSFNFNNFNIIFLFNKGGPPVPGQSAGATDILISWVYNLTFTDNNYKMAAAISIIMGVVVAAFALYQFRRTRSFREEGY